jgi:hypothetical protein
MICKSDYEKIEKKINKKGGYEIFQFYIRKIKLFGNGTLFSGDVYILRYPEIAFMSIEKAYEIGLKYVLSKKDYLTPNEDGRIYDHYTWGRKRDFENRTVTECSEKWVEEVLGEYSFFGKKRTIFFDYIAGKNVEKILDEKYNFIWEDLWQARIVENSWSCENHIEEVDSHRVEL